ncbi:iron ABC transporter permease [Thioclava sp. GXIMD2076]|uniref:iron ABC transporter permease n=1 Tax=Thioclava sp. GXIMD2076 TaxID=3131931 RepID=UPI0030D08398
MRAKAVLSLALLGLALADLSLGRFLFSPGDLWAILAAGPAGEMWVLLIDLRLPRVMLAIGAGMALGLSGALCQSLFRNPLAAPEMLGVTAGATFGAVLVILAGAQGMAVTLGAGAGAFGGLLGLVVLAGRACGLSRLILTGVGLTLTLGGLTGLLVAQADDRLAGDAILWMTGSLNGSYWARTALVWAVVLPLCGAALWARGVLLRLEMGDELARALGLRVAPARLGVLLIAAIAVASAVAVVGPVGFVGLMAGPLSRALSRQMGVRTSGPDLPGAALCGALVLVVADLMVTATAPWALMPAGVFTGILGAPLLVVLVGRSGRKGDGAWA